MTITVIDTLDGRVTQPNSAWNYNNVPGFGLLNDDQYYQFVSSDHVVKVDLTTTPGVLVKVAMSFGFPNAVYSPNMTAKIYDSDGTTLLYSTTVDMTAANSFTYNSIGYTWIHQTGIAPSGSHLFLMVDDNPPVTGTYVVFDSAYFETVDPVGGIGNAGMLLRGVGSL